MNQLELIIKHQINIIYPNKIINILKLPFTSYNCSPQDRMFLSMLSCSHLDTFELQITHNNRLLSLNNNEKQLFIESFPFTDTITYQNYRLKLKKDIIKVKDKQMISTIGEKMTRDAIVSNDTNNNEILL